MLDRWDARNQRVVEKQNEKFKVHARSDSPPALILAFLWLVNGLNFAVSGTLHLRDGQTDAGALFIAFGLVLVVVGSAMISSRFGRRHRRAAGPRRAGPQDATGR
jgi:hypothetical protein